MKKILSILLGYLVVLHSCDILDLKPQTQWSVINVPSEISHLGNILNGGYERMGNVLLSNFVVYGDERADVYYINSTTQIHNRIAFSLLDGDMSQSNWSSFYQIIRQANINIEYVPQMISDNTITAAEGNTIFGQACCQRAFTYFWLTRIWGEVPLRLKAVLNSGDDFTIRKSSVDEVFKCIHNDLDSAYKYIPAQTAATMSRVRFSPVAVRALRASVYMWQHNYAAALTELDAVVSAPNYSLATLWDEAQTPPISDAAGNAFRQYIATTQFSKMFNSQTSATGSESIFEIAFSDQSMSLNNIFDSYWVTTNGTQFKVREQMAEMYTRDDFRYYATVAPMDGGGKINAIKWVTGYSRGQNRNLVLMRLADFILLRAEANIMLSDSDPTDAQRNAIMTDINRIRTRAMGAGAAIPAGDGSDGGYLDRNVFDKAEFMRTLKRERQKELMFEGQRWFDLVRWGETKEALGNMQEAVFTNNYPFNTGPVYLSDTGLDLVWPVNNEEIRRSKGRIEQNVYYR